MRTRLSSFLDGLRSSDEGRRRRFAALGTAIVMVFVFALWLLAFQANIKALSSSAPAADLERDSTFLGTFRIGGAIVWERIASLLAREREVTIERKEFTFTHEEGAAPVHTLPVEQ